MPTQDELLGIWQDFLKHRKTSQLPNTELFFRQLMGCLRELRRQVGSYNPQGQNFPITFISYAWPDRNRQSAKTLRMHSFLHLLEAIIEYLTNSGNTVFFDDGDMQGNFEETQRNWIRRSDFVILIGTKRLKQRVENEANTNAALEFQEIQAKVLERRRTQNQGGANHRESSTDFLIPLMLDGEYHSAFPESNSLQLTREMIHDFRGLAEEEFDFSLLRKLFEGIFFLRPRGVIQRIFKIDGERRLNYNNDVRRPLSDSIQILRETIELRARVENKTLALQMLLSLLVVSASAAVYYLNKNNIFSADIVIPSIFSITEKDTENSDEIADIDFAVVMTFFNACLPLLGAAFHVAQFDNRFHLEPKNRLHILEGNESYAECDYTNAEKYYLQALAVDGKDEIAHNNLGIVYYASKQYFLALEHLNSALQLNPDHPTSRYNRGLVYNALEEYDKAIDDFYFVARKQCSLKDSMPLLRLLAEAYGNKISELNKNHYYLEALGLLEKASLDLKNASEYLKNQNVDSKIAVQQVLESSFSEIDFNYISLSMEDTFFERISQKTFLTIGFKNHPTLSVEGLVKILSNSKETLKSLTLSNCPLIDDKLFQTISINFQQLAELRLGKITEINSIDIHNCKSLKFFDATGFENLTQISLVAPIEEDINHFAYRLWNQNKNLIHIRINSKNVYRQWSRKITKDYLTTRMEIGHGQYPIISDKKLNLSNLALSSTLSEESVHLLIELVNKYNYFFDSIDISNLKASENALTALFNFLKKNKNLRKIKACGCELNAHFCSGMADLLNHNQNIEEFISYQTINIDAAKNLAQSVENHTKLKILNLGYAYRQNLEKIGNEVITAFSKALKINKSVEILYMRYNFGLIGIKTIADILKINTTIKGLIINRPEKDDELVVLADMITSNKKLEYLVYSYSNKEPKIEASSEANLNLIKSLETNKRMRLISFESLKKDQEILKLAQMIEGNFSLEYLIIGDYNNVITVTDDTMRYLANALKKNNSIQTIYLNFYFSPSGAKILAHALEKNRTIRDIWFHPNSSFSIDEYSRNILIDSLSKNPFIEKIHFYNDLGGNNNLPLIDIIENHKNLKEIWMGFKFNPTHLEKYFFKNSSIQFASLFNARHSMIEKKIDENRKKSEALLVAVYDQDLEKIIQLCKEGVFCNEQNRHDNYNTPLHYALNFYGNIQIEIIKKLLGQGANVDIKNGYYEYFNLSITIGESALHSALSKNLTDSALIMARNTHAPNLRNHDNLNYMDLALLGRSQVSPDNQAEKEKWDQIIQVLREKGALSSEQIFGQPKAVVETEEEEEIAYSSPSPGL